ESQIQPMWPCLYSDLFCAACYQYATGDTGLWPRVFCRRFSQRVFLRAEAVSLLVLARIYRVVATCVILRTLPRLVEQPPWLVPPLWHGEPYQPLGRFRQRLSKLLASDTDPPPGRKCHLDLLGPRM